MHAPSSVSRLAVVQKCPSCSCTRSKVQVHMPKSYHFTNNVCTDLVPSTYVHVTCVHTATISERTSCKTMCIQLVLPCCFHHKRPNSHCAEHMRTNVVRCAQSLTRGCRTAKSSPTGPSQTMNRRSGKKGSQTGRCVSAKYVLHICMYNAH